MKASTPLSLCSIAYLPLIVLRELHAWNPLGPRTFGERRDTHFRFSTRKSFSALSKHDCSSSKFRQKKEPVILCAEQGQSYSGEVPRIVEQEGPPAVRSGDHIHINYALSLEVRRCCRRDAVIRGNLTKSDTQRTYTADLCRVMYRSICFSLPARALEALDIAQSGLACDVRVLSHPRHRGVRVQSGLYC